MYKIELLLLIIFVICVSGLSLSYCHVCSLQPCGQLLRKVDLLALECVMFSCVFATFPIWCPWSGVVLDCIDH